MSPRFTNKQLALIALLLDEQCAENQANRRFWINPKLLQHPIDGEFNTLHNKLLDDEVKFYNSYRMSIAQFECLHGKLEQKILKRDTKFRKAISTKQKLAVCLRFLTTGDSFQKIAFSQRLGHSTVSKIVKDVCVAIIETLKPTAMPTPTKESWQTVANGFSEHWDFPNCIGALGVKHVVITAPKNFLNENKNFSVVLLALVDAFHNIIAIDVGSYEENSAGGIFSNSNLRRAFEDNKLNVPDKNALPDSNIEAPYVAIGDEAFPLKSYLLRPYPGLSLQEDDSKRHFNERLSRARGTVENAFGMLSQKFQIYNKRIKSQPQYVNNIILATCVLHNFIQSYDQVKEHAITTSNLATITQGQLRSIPGQGGNASMAAFAARDIFKDYFCSAQGRPKWKK